MRHRFESELLDRPGSVANRLLVEVQAVEDGLLGKKGEPADCPGLVRRERHGAERRLALQLLLQAAQNSLFLELGLFPLLLDRRLEALQTPLDDLKIREDELGLEILDVPLRHRSPQRVVGESPDHVEQRVGVPEVLGLEPRPLAPLDTREVNDLERGIRRLPRLEQGGEPVDARIAHARDPGVQLGAPGVVARGRDLGAGEQVEEGGLSRLGESDQADLHAVIMPGVVSSRAF